MEFSLKSSNVLSASADRVILLRFERGVREDTFKKADRKLNGFLERKLKINEFDGKFGKSITVDTLDSYKFSQLTVTGLGEKSSFNSLSAFRLGTIIGNSVKNTSESVAIDYPNIQSSYLGLIIEGILLGFYGYNSLKTEKQSRNITEKITFHTKKLSSATFKSRASQAEKIAASISVARDLVNDPPNMLTPEILANHAVSISEENDSLECTVYTEKDIEEMGMNALRAVSLGSNKPPRFIHMKYTPDSRTTRQVAIVGKGITFDSGGLCIKPADGMKTMKMDMAGAAVVIGVMKAISELKPKVVVHGLIPTTENMTGGSAYKPDDVIKVLNGKTVEIVNTDAEGRMAMSDALSYAVKNGVSEIIDLATLTGACIVGLGPYTAGVMGNNPKNINSILKSAENTGEKMWQLPLDDELSDEIRSHVADIKNSGSRWGGAITAGLFLQNFVGDTPWTHIDIAGPSFIEKPNEWYPYGATGFGIKTVVDYLLNK